MGDPYTAPLQTDEHDVGQPVVAFDDLVADAPNRPAYVIGAENLGLDMKNAPCGGRGIHIGTGHFDMISSVRASQDSFDGCRHPSRVDPGDERTGHVHSAHSPHNVTSSTWARSCEWTRTSASCVGRRCAAPEVGQFDATCSRLEAELVLAVEADGGADHPVDDDRG